MYWPYSVPLSNILKKFLPQYISYVCEVTIFPMYIKPLHRGLALYISCVCVCVCVLTYTSHCIENVFLCI